MHESDLRVTDTDTLVELHVKAHEHGFNRCGMAEDAFAQLDPAGTHVLAMRLWGHNIDASSVMHHRVEVLAKQVGTMDPLGFLLDVSNEDWQNLAKAPKVEVK